MRYEAKQFISPGAEFAGAFSPGHSTAASSDSPINRLFFVGRNYHAHAVEMGRSVDKSIERPFY
ncbi:MAG: hypothetical protein ABI831_06115, partial [Betaproteobacteria bacterium]